MRSELFTASRAFLAAVLGVACFLAPALAEGQTGSGMDFTGVLVPGAANGPESVGWTRVPSAAQISRVFPANATYSAATEWKCDVSPSGTLSHCTLEAQRPRGDQRYAIAARKLLPIFRVDARTTELARHSGKKIVFSVPIYRPGSKPLASQECQPPFCVPVLPPPKK